MPHPYPASPLKIIHVSGTDRAIGRQHAELVGEAAKKGMPKFYYELWRRILGSHVEGNLRNGLLQAAKWFVDPLLMNRLAAQVPDALKDRMQGVCDVTGTPYKELATALLLPDLLPMLQAYLTKIQPGKFIDVATPPGFGCSSFVANGDRFLMGRNLDFPGVAYWDRYPVVQVTAKTGDLQYIGFTSAGVPIAGITGVNEAQICVALHQHYCRETSLRGILPFVIAEEVLGKARTLKEAQRILEQHKVASSWAFIVADGKSRDAFIFESHPRARGIVRMPASGALAHSNFFQSEECRPAGYATTARMNWDNYWRKTRLEKFGGGGGRGAFAGSGVRFHERPLRRVLGRREDHQSHRLPGL